MHAEFFERPMNLIEIMAADRRSCRKSDAFVAALLPGMGYQSPLPPRDVGGNGGVGLWRHRLGGCPLRGTDRPQVRSCVFPDRGRSTIVRALQGAGSAGVTAQAGFVPAPEPMNTGTATPPLDSQSNKPCTRATRPFFDNDCLWDNTAEGGTQERRRSRIVARLKSPGCSGLAYFCRPRT
jgi:hypothetical protein